MDGKDLRDLFREFICLRKKVSSIEWIYMNEILDRLLNKKIAKVELDDLDYEMAIKEWDKHIERLPAVKEMTDYLLGKKHETRTKTRKGLY